MQNHATPFRLFLAALALCVASAAFAQATGEPARDAGDVIVRPLGADLFGAAPNAAEATGVIYDNTSSTLLYAFSSTDLNSTWGDQLTASGTGLLSQAKFTVFNSGTSAGSLLTATVQLQFFDAVTSALLGGFSTNVNFGGLAPGYYSTVTVTSLDALNIAITTPNVFVTQKITARTGTASRLGFVSLDPPSVGSSPAYFYASSSTVGGGAAGFYTLSGGAANPGYQLYVIDFPVSNRGTTWGRLKSLY